MSESAVLVGGCEKRSLADRSVVGRLGTEEHFVLEVVIA